MFCVDDLFFLIAGPAHFFGKCADESATRYAVQQNSKQKGYNLTRQNEIKRMAYSASAEERTAFNHLVRRTVRRGKNSWDVILAIRQISLLEGWKYYDAGEQYSDPAYVELIGGKWPDYQIPGEFCGKFVGDDKAREMNMETARREEWRSRTTHGTCVEIFPMDYETENAYQEAVAHAYSLTHRRL